MTTYYLRCLGIPELRDADGKLVRLRVRKHIALLVFLAVEQQRQHSRDRLVDLFWSRSPRSQARHSLATALSVLRSILGRGAFTSNRQHLRFHPTNLALDLDRLDAGDVLGKDGELPLEVDGFLAGFDLNDAPEFSLWREREHARRLPMIHSGLLTLIDHSRRQGATAHIAALANRLISIDHLAEEGVRARMEALALAGDRVGALRAFEEWKSQLFMELGAVPSELLEGMAVRLRQRGVEPTLPTAIPPVPAEQWRDRMFVGRLDEYRQLYEAWEDTHQFRPRHLLIMGDSGVGKTTLAQRLVTAAGLEGAAVSRVQCFPLEQKIPYSAIGGLVVGLLGRPGIAATAPDSLAEVGRIVPKVRERFPDLPQPKESGGEAARLRFSEGVMDILIALTDEYPLLLVVDDYHLADEASLAVLHLLLRRLPARRMMVVLTARPTEEAETKQARRIREGTGHLNMTQLPLAPMPEEECRQLLDVILSEAERTPVSIERRALIRASHGYPMVLELLVQDWFANGPNCLALSFHAMTADYRTGGNMSESYAQLASRLIPDLPAQTRQVLEFASVLGPRLGDMTWYGLIDLSTGQTMAGLSQLVAKRILRDMGGGMEFINELIRAQIYGGIPSTIRVTLHAAVADRLLQESSYGREAPGLELAWHLIRSGRTEAAGPHLLRGAREAVHRGAPDDAVLALNSAIDKLEWQDRGNLELLLTEVLQETGQWTKSLATLQSSAETTDRGLAILLRTEADFELGSLTSDTQRQIVVDLLTNARVSHDVSFASKSLFLAARIGANLRCHNILTMALIAANAIDSTHWAPHERARLLICIGMLQFHLRNRAASIEAAIAARELLNHHRIADSLSVQANLGVGALAASLGDYRPSCDALREARLGAIRIDNETLLGRISSNLGLVCCRLGEFDEAVMMAKESRSNLLSGPPDGFAATAAFTLSFAEALRGDDRKAIAAIEEGNTWLSSPQLHWVISYWQLCKADVLHVLGRTHAAKRMAASVVQISYPEGAGTSLIGRYCRWASMLHQESRGAFDATQQILSHYKIRDQCDEIDRLEILMSLKTIDPTYQLSDQQGLETELALSIARLPPQTIEQLQRLGTF